MSLRLSIAVLASVGALALFAPDAHAGSSLGHDEVSLKNGGSIRCTVVSVEPGTKVVILEMGSDQPRTLTWAEVADVQKGKYPDESEPAPKVEPGEGGPDYAEPKHTKKKHKAKHDEDEGEDEGAEDEAGPRGVVRVHIQTPKPVRLIEEVGTATGMAGKYVVTMSTVRTACISPCDKVIDGSSGQKFYIEGDGVTAAGGFTLAEFEKSVAVKVDPGSKALRGGGIGVTIAGGLVLVGGVGMLIGGFLGSYTERIQGHTVTYEQTGLKVAGGVLTAVGAGGIAGGIAMIVAGKTGLKVEGGAPKSALAEKRARAPRYWAGEF